MWVSHGGAKKSKSEANEAGRSFTFPDSHVAGGEGRNKGPPGKKGVRGS